MSVRIAEDRSVCVRRDQVVRTAWVDIDQCRLGSRVPMAVATLEKKATKLINLGDEVAPWPPIVGHWEGERFTVWDGRHEYLASLMLGRDKLFVCWLADGGETGDASLVAANKQPGPPPQENFVGEFGEG